LIDVRDLEEVGAGPLMEELGLDEATAEIVLERCSEEAKIVAVEQAAKKAADAASRAAGKAAFGSANASASAGMDGRASAEAFANPLLPQGPNAVVKSEDENGDIGEPTPDSERMPSALEATNGVAPELVTHNANSFASEDDLSPEEQAMSGIEVAPADEPERDDDESTEAAALAEGRSVPPLA
jgi:hypothetical protein